jgi:hypothetical protein
MGWGLLIAQERSQDVWISPSIACALTHAGVVTFRAGHKT